MSAAATLVANYRREVEKPDRHAPTAYPSLVPKRYPTSPRIALPWPLAGYPASLAGDLAALGALFMAYAPVRLSLFTPAAVATLTGFPMPQTVGASRRYLLQTCRQVASGGASFPAELYLITAGTPSLAAGAYHYFPVHHALERVRGGDLRAAIALPAGTSADHLLVLACRPWKNVQKYGDFYYRLSSLDTGVLLDGLLSEGVRAVRFLHEDHAVAEALWLDPAIESAYAVLELSERLFPQLAVGPAEGAAAESPDQAAVVAAVPTGLELDQAGVQTVHPATIALHRASMCLGRPGEPASVGVGESSAPPGCAANLGVNSAGTGPAGTTELVTLPAARAVDLRAQQAGRRSAVGFRPGPVRLDQMATVLAQAGAALGVDSDLPAALADPLTLYCVGAELPGLAPGAYQYRRAEHAVLRCGTPDAAAELLAVAAGPGIPAMYGAQSIFVTGPQSCGLDALGARWYRVLNALAGVVVNRIYLAAAAAGLGARAMLGYDVDTVGHLLGLPAGHTALAQVLIGMAVRGRGSLDLALADQCTGLTGGADR
ncbi:MAG: SagB/ThcOx family dehydrogenase [Micromonosporaceae bacterium]|nr:SagB/ThcOx family dehydrogenase [Micromonosporaceae bacterium]